jgi:hypothetical protein
MKSLYDQSTSTASGSFHRRDEPKEAAKRSIDRVGLALDKVFADARSQQRTSTGRGGGVGVETAVDASV